MHQCIHVDSEFRRVSLPKLNPEAAVDRVPDRRRLDPAVIPVPELLIQGSLRVVVEGVLHEIEPGLLEAAEQDPAEFLARHSVGDWGDLVEEDKRENELSLAKGFRLLSAYALGTGVKIWIITERDRSATTILLPNEY